MKTFKEHMKTAFYVVSMISALCGIAYFLIRDRLPSCKAQVEVKIEQQAQPEVVNAPHC